MTKHWNTGDIFVWRGMYRNHIWHAVPTYVVRETPREIVGAILPQAICMVEQHYTPGVKASKRRWNFEEEDWVLKEFLWRTNRVLTITEPETYDSIMLFWNHTSHEFLGYYVNFQIPFKKSHCGIDRQSKQTRSSLSGRRRLRWQSLKSLKGLKNAATPSTARGWIGCLTPPGLRPRCPKIGIRYNRVSLRGGLCPTKQSTKV